MKLFSAKNSGKSGHDPEPIRLTAGRLYDLHAPWLLAVCIRYCGNREDAEDVLHDGFIKIFRHLDRFNSKHPGAMEAWMKRIVVNTALNFLRDHSKFQRLISQESAAITNNAEDEFQNSGETFEDAGLSAEQLLEMVCELPPGYRTVFNLYVLESWTHKEIAEKLQCSEGTSKSQLSKARAMLRVRINEYQKKNEYENTAASHR